MKMSSLKWLFAVMTVLLFTSTVVAQDTAYAVYRPLITKNASRMGTTQSDMQSAVITNAYTDPSSGISFVYVQQAFKETKLYNTIITAAFLKGNFLYASGNFVKDVVLKVAAVTPIITYEAAIKLAAKHLLLNEVATLTLTEDRFLTQKKYFVTATTIAKRDIEASLVLTPSEDQQQVRLSWNINIDVLHSSDWWNIRIDALTGEFVAQDNWTVSESISTPAKNVAEMLDNSKRPIGPVNIPPFKIRDNKLPAIPPVLLQAAPAVTTATYKVIPFPIESPNFGVPATVTDPWMLSGVGNNATTNGWHYDGTTDYNITRGNNVFAFLDIANNNTANATTNWPDTSTTPIPALNFVNTPDFAQQPIQSGLNINKKFAIDNLFYWNNQIHDLFYQYGFNEASGNFQTNNLSRGGAGNDHVMANTMDQGGFNNANFSTPNDGGSGRMQMYLWIGRTPLLITSPESIAGSYNGAEAGLSPLNNKLIKTGPKSGSVVLYNDNAAGTVHSACLPPFNAAAIAGNIALIDFFGGAAPCSTYAYKIKNAQNAGAIAVIVYSNSASVPGVGGSDATAQSITIPVMSISQNTANAIIAQLDLGNPVLATMQSGIYLDGDIDNGIITHEYGHGISTRLTGGPANSSCLGNSEQGGEGWSDYLSLMMTTNWATAALSDGNILRPMGTYATNQAPNGVGIRRYPYSTDMVSSPLTYANLPTSVVPHGVGEVWCNALWEMTWSIIQQQGSITPNLFNSSATGGNVVALNLVMMGMKLQPCSPGFIDARNAILAADSILYGYAHKCAIWNAFARRGMGASAKQGSSTSVTDQTAAFDVPASMRADKPSATIVSINNQTTLTHTLNCDCQPLTGVVVRDTIPSGFTYISSSPAGTLNGDVLTFPAANFIAQESKNFSIVLKAPASGCLVDTVINDNREVITLGGLTSSGTPGWISSTTKPNSGTNSWFAAEPATPTSSSLTSAVTAATAAQNLSILTFNHYYNTETFYDGGVVEYSTDNGMTWLDASPLFFRAPNTIQMDASTSLTGRKAFTGNSIGYIPTFLNLTTLGASPVRFRFRLEADNGGAGQGWYIDDVVRANGCGNFLKSGLYNNANVLQDTLMQPIFVTTADPLPLTLLWLYATPIDGQIALDWKTVSEIGVKDFKIEWSIDGANWVSINSVNALNGNTNNYNFVHANPVSGNNYYRIKMSDRDGKFSYSIVRMVNMKEKGKPKLVLLPNPVSSDALLYISKDLKARSVKIYNATGALVRNINVSSGVLQIKIATADLAAGVYMIETTGAERLVTRMLVQH